VFSWKGRALRSVMLRWIQSRPSRICRRFQSCRRKLGHFGARSRA
jgi:hypothetical protein